jgi:hypothetical protein
MTGNQIFLERDSRGPGFFGSTSLAAFYLAGAVFIAIARRHAYGAKPQS